MHYRSYGSVFKALHRSSSQVLAIKQVPVDTDLQEIIKEISIMQQCDSPYVVKYYGSYFKNSDLWVSVLQAKCIRCTNFEGDFKFDVKSHLFVSPPFMLGEVYCFHR